MLLRCAQSTSSLTTIRQQHSSELGVSEAKENRQSENRVGENDLTSIPLMAGKIGKAFATHIALIVLEFQHE